MTIPPLYPHSNRADPGDKGTNHHMSLNRGNRVMPSEAARAIGIDRSTLSRWAREGKVRYSRTLGGHRRYSAADIDELIGQTTREPTVPVDAEAAAYRLTRHLVSGKGRDQGENSGEKDRAPSARGEHGKRGPEKTQQSGQEGQVPATLGVESALNSLPGHPDSPHARAGQGLYLACALAAVGGRRPGRCPAVGWPSGQHQGVPSGSPLGPPCQLRWHTSFAGMPAAREKPMLSPETGERHQPEHSNQRDRAHARYRFHAGAVKRGRGIRTIANR